MFTTLIKFFSKMLSVVFAKKEINPSSQANAIPSAEFITVQTGKPEEIEVVSGKLQSDDLILFLDERDRTLSALDKNKNIYDL
jgi:hypothetical protein